MIQIGDKPGEIWIEYAREVYTSRGCASPMPTAEKLYWCHDCGGTTGINPSTNNPMKSKQPECCGKEMEEYNPKEIFHVVDEEGERIVEDIKLYQCEKCKTIKTNEEE